MNKITFINYYNKGDIHVSRGFVKKIIEKVRSLNLDIKFAYSHKHDPDLLKDIQYLDFDKDGLLAFHNFCTSQGLNPQHTDVFNIDGNYYFNTWYAQKERKYLDEHGITFDTLYFIFDDICKKILNFSLEDISDNLLDFYPDIDFTKFDTKNIDNWIADNKFNKKIFVANGHSLSGQSYNVNFTRLITDIAKKKTDTYFLLTNIEDGKISLPNVIYTDDIIKKNSFNDLNENAYLSTFCDVIIGRGSGASSFAFNCKNILNSNIIFIYFCNFVSKDTNKFWVGKYFNDKINYAAKFKISDSGHEETLANIIANSV